MKKKLALLLACLLVLSLSACVPAEQEALSSAPAVTAAPEQHAEPATAEPEQEEATEEITENAPEENTGEALDEQTLRWFQTMYFNFNLIDGSNESNLQNMMLRSEYQAVADVDLFSLFYNGVIGTYMPVSAQEQAALEALDESAAYLDVVKITRSQMDRVLLQNAGLTLSQTSMLGLEQFIYLEDYDAYYLVHSDTNAVGVKLVSGWCEADGSLRLHYKLKDTSTTGVVTLKRTPTAYWFVSNVYDTP